MPKKKANPARMVTMELPLDLPKGVSLVHRPGPPAGGYKKGKNPYREGTAEWKAFERYREENYNPWAWQFSSFKAFKEWMDQRARH